MRRASGERLLLGRKRVGDHSRERVPDDHDQVEDVITFRASSIEVAQKRDGENGA